MKPFWITVPVVVALTVGENSCQKKAAVPLPPTPVPATPEAPPEQTPPSATSAPRRPARQPATSAPPANAPQSNPPLRLGDMLTPEQQRQYNTAIDQAVARAQTNLGAVANRQLTREQQATVAQVQNFIQQAQTTRKTDLPTAKSLAERADVLARDLAKSLR